MSSQPPPFPEQLGVFPLPQVVLFPHAHLPLHVFEPRYRALLRDALEADKRFVMAVLKPGYETDYYGSPEVHAWACAGRVVKHHMLPDGCSDVVLRGERVVRLEGLVRETPYRIARIRALEDDDRFAREPGAAERLEELRALMELACPGAERALESRLLHRPEEDGGMELLHTIASSFPVPVERKLEWLACADTLERWERIRDTLRQMGDERGRKTRAIERYSDLKPSDPKRN